MCVYVCVFGSELEKPLSTLLYCIVPKIWELFDMLTQIRKKKIRY